MLWQRLLLLLLLLLVLSIQLLLLLLLLLSLQKLLLLLWRLWASVKASTRVVARRRTKVVASSPRSHGAPSCKSLLLLLLDGAVNKPSARSAHADAGPAGLRCCSRSCAVRLQRLRHLTRADMRSDVS
jgi:hypothetical protein